MASAETASIAAELDRVAADRAFVAQTPHSYAVDLDISSERFWTKSFAERDKTFARLRGEAPVSFHRPIEIHRDHTEKGFWAVVRAEDISEVARMDEAFSSYPTNIVAAFPQRHTSFFHRQDGLTHRRNRSAVSAAFTAKQITRMLDEIQRTAAEVIGDLRGAGDVDFVDACASRVPGIMGARILGIPKDEQERFARSSNQKVGIGDPEFSDADAVWQAEDYLFELGRSMAEYRRRVPGDDLMSNLVNVEIDGHRLSDADIGGFTALMSAASNDTTKQSSTHTLMALEQNPQQKQWLLDDIDGRLPLAIGEFLRWATPVLSHARTAVRDIEFRGQEITKGDKIGIFYCSGNRDEDRFVEPMAFDLSRKPNPHISFGGGGVHYCLGSRLAIAILHAVFKELLTLTTVTITGEPEFLLSTSINGVKRLPVNFA